MDFISKNLTVKIFLPRKLSLTLTSECHVIRLGNIAFASNQFELFMDYEQRIQARSPAEQTFIIQLPQFPETEEARIFLPLRLKQTKDIPQASSTAT